jgi:hypothetical protein
MDHETTREQLELAALEPGGLDRLMAGDTAAAQAVAAHLAGCPTCADELVRLQRASIVIRSAVRELPSPELKDLTLAAVAATGVARGGAATFASSPSVSTQVLAPVAAVAEPTSLRAARASRTPALGWIAAIAAAVVLSVITTTVVVGNRVDEQLAAQAETVAALEEVTTGTLAITAQPDAEHVALTGTSDPALTGSLAFSPSTTQLVVVTSGLTEPPAGQEYRCWVEIGGQRQRVGKMFFSTDLAYWVGPVPALSGLSTDATFGVSLVDISAPGATTTPVMVGDL